MRRATCTPVSRSLICGAARLPSSRRFSTQSAAGSDTEESWYLDMWRRLVFPPQSIISSTEAASELPGGKTAATMQPQDVLRAVGNHLPDSAVNGLWVLYHSIRDDEMATQFFVSLSKSGPDLERIRSHQKKLLEVTATYELACKEVSSASTPSQYKQRQSAEKTFMKAVAAMEASATPICERWFHQSTGLPNGIRWLMELRRRLLQTISTVEQKSMNAKGNDTESSSLEATLYDLKALDERLLSAFREFFAKQYLLLEELTWKTTPPYVLERVIASEAVHPFPSGLESLKLRIRGGYSSQDANSSLQGQRHQRHLFALYHPAVADEPLISIQVALCKGIERSVDAILNRPTPLDALDAAAGAGVTCGDMDTAIFYSINNAQPSLKGIELGSMLIKRVVSSITTQPYKYIDPHTGRPHPIKEFSTLSPMPGFMRWLSAEAAKLERGLPHRIFGSSSPEESARHFAELKAAVGGGDMTEEQTMFVILNMFNDTDEFRRRDAAHVWFWNKNLTDALRGPMMRSAAAYLVEEKRRSSMLDPVGNFHVGNGAILHRVNWLANCSEKGSLESACMMVNYRYDLTKLGEYSTRYGLEHIVPLGDDVKTILA